ncbi:hypothetical protein M3Y99_01448100 [Aphelenchoides fujianensis]|nr:hypothetical protein M3Y99_01448100 [Aphelenchoides fujianensis]
MKATFLLVLLLIGCTHFANAQFRFASSRNYRTAAVQENAKTSPATNNDLLGAARHQPAAAPQRRAAAGDARSIGSLVAHSPHLLLLQDVRLQLPTVPVREVPHLIGSSADSVVDDQRPVFRTF